MVNGRNPRRPGAGRDRELRYLAYFPVSCGVMSG